MTTPSTSATVARPAGTLMTDGGTTTECEDPLLSVYRHDLHKARGRSHEHAAETIEGVPVNEPVPLNADRDAALLSRPRGSPTRTVRTHATPVRLRLTTGQPATTELTATAETVVTRSVQTLDPTTMHAVWLHSVPMGQLNESVYYPYTSLKFRTLLAAALLDNYQAGYAFDELSLVVDQRPEPAGDTDAPPPLPVIPHRTILMLPTGALRLTGEPAGQPAASLGAAPAQSWADVWSRLPIHPLPVETTRRARVIDAHLRRIRSWSTALQYLESRVRDWEIARESNGGTQ